MYDFAKLDISYLGFNALYKNPLLEWRPLVDPIHGELNPIFIDRYGKKGKRPDYVAEYRGLTFEAFNTSSSAKHRMEITVSGSLHRYKNDGKHNGNAYTLEDHRSVVKQLEKDFGIIPQETVIQCLEIFVLIFDCKYDVNEIIINTLYHQVKGAETKRYNNREHRTPSVFNVMIRKQYRLKEYNPGLRFGLGDIFKFEINLNRTKILNDIGVRVLSDLAIPDKIIAINKILLNKWHETFVYDWTIDKSALSNKQVMKLRDYRNPLYWMKLSKKRNAISKERKKYNKIVKDHSQQIHNYIGYIIEQNGCKFQLSNKMQNGCKITNTIGSSCNETALKYLWSSSNDLIALSPICHCTPSSTIIQRVSSN
jgi:hypothetical protein